MLVSNFEIQPEKAYNFEFATDFNWDGLNLTARYFHSWVDNLIQLRETNSSLTNMIDEFENQDLIAFSHSNVSESQIYGFSLQTSYLIRDLNITISSGMTYVKGKNLSEENEPLAGISPLFGLAAIEYEHRNLKMKHQISLQSNHEKPLSEFANNSADRKNYFLDSDGAPNWQTFNYRVEWQAHKKIKTTICGRKFSRHALSNFRL